MKSLLLSMALLLAACTPVSQATSPTPDLAALKTDAPLLLMNVADLPSEGKYLLPEPTGTGELDNQAVLDAWGADEGGQYISETGRVDGWWIQFNRTSDGAPVPSEVYDSVVLYRTPGGARVSVEKYAGHGMANYVEVQGTDQIGDGARAFVLKNGSNVDYVLYFSLRNFQHIVEIIGLENEATPAFANTIAQALARRIESASQPSAAP